MTISGSVFDAASPPLTGGCDALRLLADAEGPGLTLWINRPEAARPPEGWPALILLDGEAYFTATAEMAQRLARRSMKTRIDPMMVVGLTLDDGADRHASFSFSPDARRPDRQARGRWLLERLLGQVLPLIEAAGADATKLALWGHSMSGQFVLETRALAGPFDRYIAVSPSIWSNPSIVEAQPARSTQENDLLVVVGGQEEMTGLAPAHLARRMVSNARSLLHRGGVRLDVLDSEDHGSAPYASLPAALRFASPGR